ncbi:hypothetical protein [Streptomyces canus]|uniref:hypothetical protein n=1 Tax=Streptomyces canus TaxID=58343 RepID=UPI00370FA611
MKQILFEETGRVSCRASPPTSAGWASAAGPRATATELREHTTGNEAPRSVEFFEALPMSGEGQGSGAEAAQEILGNGERQVRRPEKQI